MPCCVDDDVLLLCGEDAGELELEREVPDDDVLSGPCAASVRGGHGAVLVALADEDSCSGAAAAAAAAAAAGAECPGRPGSAAVADRPGWPESVSWILKVRSYHGFQPATAYLAVTYMHRFLSSRTLPDQGWALQLLTVACLSLAAKMEETYVPPLLDLQILGTRFIFEPRTIQRMELLILVELDWRLRSLTPFAFVDLFACKADPSGRCTGRLALRACQITLNAIHEAELLSHCPSSMAAAAVLCAVNETPAMASESVSPEAAAAWCPGLTEEGVSRCYQLLQQQALTGATARRKHEHPMVLPPKLRSMASSSVICSSSPSKRRRLDCHFGEEQ